MVLDPKDSASLLLATLDEADAAENDDGALALFLLAIGCALLFSCATMWAVQNFGGCCGGGGAPRRKPLPTELEVGAHPLLIDSSLAITF